MTDVLCLGDLVGYGPFPNEVAALVRDHGIATVMGNYDQGIGFETGDCGCAYKTDEQRAEGAASLAWTEQAASAVTRAYLRTLEDRFVLETPAGELLAVHGSPRRINEYLFEDRPETSLVRLAAADPYRAIVFGHTHIPYIREVAGTAFINVGSGGRPKDGDWRCVTPDRPARGRRRRPRRRIRARALRLRQTPRGHGGDVVDDDVRRAASILLGVSPVPLRPAADSRGRTEHRHTRPAHGKAI